MCTSSNCFIASSLLVGLQPSEYNFLDYKELITQELSLLMANICNLRPFQLFNRFPDWLFSTWKIKTFVSIPHLPKCQSSKKAFCTCIGTNAMHDTRSTGPKSCSVSPSTVLDLVLAIQMVSICWVAVTHGLLQIVGKVRGCFILVKEQ